ncbi:MAG: GAF domain-containing protein [Xenococcaceae cyanobacterium]
MTSASNFDREGQDLTDISDSNNQLSVPEDLAKNNFARTEKLKQFPNKVIQNLHQAVNLEEVLKVTVEEAQRLLECDRAIVYGLTESSQGKVIAEAVVNGWTKILGTVVEDPCLEADYLAAYQNGKVKVLNNIYASGMLQCYIEQLEALEVKAIIVAPLLKQGQLFGLLVAHQCSQPRVWQLEEINLFKQLSTYVGFALDNAQLLEQFNRIKQQQAKEVEWTKFYTDAVARIRKSLQEQDILDVSVREVRRVLEGDRVVIYSLEPDNYGVVMAEAVVPGWTRALGMTINDPCFEAKYLEQYQNGQVCAFKNIYEAEIASYYLEQLEKLEVKANLVVPIMSQGKIFGLLVAHQCSNPRDWQPLEIRYVTQIATQIGFAVDSAKVLARSTHLQTQVDKENRWMQSLKKFIKYIRPDSQQSDILAMTVDEARRVLNCDRVLVYSLKEDRYGEVIAESVAPGWTRALGMIIEDPCFALGYQEKYQNGRVKAVDNIQEAKITSCHLEQLEQLEVKANLVIPLLVEGKIFGLLVAHFCDRPHHWQPLEINFLSELAREIGVKLERAELIDKQNQLEARAEKEAQLTDFFTQAIRHIRQSLQTNNILDVTVQEVYRVLKCDRVVVYSLEWDSYGKVLAEALAPGGKRTLGKVIQDPCLEARHIEKYRNGCVKAIDNIDTARITSCYLEELEKLEVKAYLVTPILNKNQLFGLLVAHQCSAPRQWQQSEIRYVTQIAIQVAFALDHAHLLQQLEQSSLKVAQISADRQQQQETLKQKVLDVIKNNTDIYQTLSQETLQQSEKVIDVLDRVQVISDALRAQVNDFYQIKLQEQQNSLKIEKLQKSLNQTIDNIESIQQSVNSAVSILQNLHQSSPKLIEAVNLARDLGKTMAQKSMKVAIAINGTDRVKQDAVVELTETVFSSMQTLYEESAQITPLLLALETDTSEGATALNSEVKKLITEVKSLKDIQNKLERINQANAQITILINRVADATQKQIQFSTSTRKSVREVANLANQIATNFLAIDESFNQLAIACSRNIEIISHE